jgi:Amt family ammonium transporter
VAALPPGVGPDGLPVTGAQVHTLALVAAAVTGAGWLLLGWAVLRSKLVNPADGVLLMMAALSIGAGSYAIEPLPTVGALLLLAAGMGLAWTGNRLIPRR